MLYIQRAEEEFNHQVSFSSGIIEWCHMTIDVMHHLGYIYLSVVVCGSSHFCMRQQLCWSNRNGVIDQLKQVLYEQEFLIELLTINDEVCHIVLQVHTDQQSQRCTTIQ